jgi:hypothetical protein
MGFVSLQADAERRNTKVKMAFKERLKIVPGMKFLSSLIVGWTQRKNNVIGL